MYSKRYAIGAFALKHAAIGICGTIITIFAVFELSFWLLMSTRAGIAS